MKGLASLFSKLNANENSSTPNSPTDAEIEEAWKSCSTGDVLKIQQFLNTHPQWLDKKNPKWKDSTLLYTAARNGKPQIIYILLNRGADPNLTQGTMGSTPLHGAAYAGHFDCVVALLENPVTDVNKTNNLNYTPEQEAANDAIKNLFLPCITCGGGHRLGKSSKCYDCINMLCNRCLKKPKNQAFGWCDDCHNEFKVQKNVFFKELTPEDSKWSWARNYFFDKWAFKKGSLKEVVAVFAVFSPEIFHRYNEYKTQILGPNPNDRNLQGHLVEKHMFHGTSMECNLYETRKWCGSPTCALCNICRTGFDMKRILSQTGFARFGKGIYFAFNSSKSHDYNFKSERVINDRKICAALICRVVAGKAYKVYEDQPNLTAPPDNCDSVLGEVGKSLNYPELVVYNDKAALPSYIVLYEHDTPYDKNRH